VSAIMGSLDHRIETLRAAPAVQRKTEVVEETTRFGREFQIDVLALMTKSYHFLLCATEIMSPESFQDEVLAFFFRAIRDTFHTQRSKPTSQDLWLAISKAAHAGRIQDDDLCAYVDVFCQLKQPKPAHQFDIDDVVEFCLAADRAPAKRRA